MKTTFIGLLFLVAPYINAQEKIRTFQLSDAPRYSEETGYGYDLTDTPEKGSKAPFFFSVRVPDGNYQVTVRLGNKKQAGVTTVRGESRRLFIDNLATQKGQFVDETFIVNKRNPRISEKESVRIKPREKAKLNWDDKLTLEFNGDAPVCQSISIKPADPSVITVFLCGNSTVVDQDNEPWASWGQMIPHFFGTDVCIANYAESGESANTFIAAGRLKKALSQIKKGDYLFMEFGHNDQKQKGPGKGAYYSFMTSLKTFIDEARARGAYPVLVTPTQRRSFDATGHIRDTHEDYPEAMRWLAAKENVPLIDLNEMTRTLYEALGTETSKRAFVHYPAGAYPGQKQDFADNTHFNPYGAYQIAQCVIEGMKKAVPNLAKHLKIDPAYNPAYPDNPDTFHWNNSPFTEIEKPDGN
ncbi:rhamnogalacturonan acetylesterase [Bacteroides finegoldii]|mgnify:FL=1|uniref:rhamnogalacturonan acetylesterase n=1 Tax=Bacteroides finegoldii TaxID=338188 RepID=UPI0032EB917D